MITNEELTLEKYIKEKRKQTKDPICAYIYDLKQLRDHAAAIKNSLPSFCRLYYAAKANSDQPLLETLDPIVDGFEVASEGEINKLVAETEKPMIFGGPGKKDREIEAAIHSNVEYLNVESFHELNRINYIAKQKNVTVPILIRVNLSVNISDSHLRMSGVPSQFGIDEREVPSFIEAALDAEFVSIEGFHFHAMSNNLDAESHVRFVKVCIDKTKLWRKQFGLSGMIVDLGGGIGINYWNPEDPFDWEILASGITGLRTEAEDLTLIIEIGRYMTAACGSYVTEVLDIKKNHDQHFAVIRGGSHHLRLPAAWKMSHPFRVYSVEEWNYPFARPEVLKTDVTVAGELCTPNDVLVRKEYVDQLRAGDIVIFEYAGAYAWTISHHEFLSHPYPEIIYVNATEK
ncbi:siderophore biosynthesis PLP-dependent protein [Halobacillus halophilus]|uniref:Pyridoxal-dependent decarboxylase n=1 Tax=Halobacillus halophilus (strain ATCC 35676 / DSM 2266 / JCM 20832 / KCTC 3685 / LMG 17431 / NBRC 102448 / NCIMB 2269) TaxID=866895 RepID=I0JSU4_HALH3|nr:type III PLP-dependent enzyme [Halobacillus halophilus]ASF41139.1 siderophore biosynthesis PLP-dependent protein [Halobacillus halophilus]CCG47216.1 pyridoxal-dependent decarboxylase [Halobacillus halophilus DSM 2266]